MDVTLSYNTIALLCCLRPRNFLMNKQLLHRLVNKSLHAAFISRLV